jgi:hypothetical protein
MKLNDLEQAQQLKNQLGIVEALILSLQRGGDDNKVSIGGFAFPQHFTLQVAPLALMYLEETREKVHAALGQLGVDVDG